MPVKPRTFNAPTARMWRGSSLGGSGTGSQGHSPHLGAAAPAVTAITQVAGVASAITGAGAIISEVESLVNFGDSHKYGQPQFTGAEKARYDAGLLGVAAGSVLAGQYLLGQHQSDTSLFSQSYGAQIISQAQAMYATVMNQANAEGPVADQADGTGVLTILLNLKVHFTEQYAGYSTNSGTLTAGALASQVAALPVTVSSSLGSLVQSITGQSTSGSGLTTLALIGGGILLLKKIL